MFNGKHVSADSYWTLMAYSHSTLASLCFSPVISDYTQLIPVCERLKICVFSNILHCCQIIQNTHFIHITELNVNYVSISLLVSLRCYCINNH